MLFQNKNSGFTLVEVIAVLAIVAITGLIARPSFSKFLERIRLRTEANTVKKQLNLAKIRALGDPNVHAGVYLDTQDTPDSILVFLDDDTTSGSKNDYLYTKGKDHLLMPSFSLPKSDTLRVVSTYPNTIVFRGDGSAKTTGKFFIKNKFGTCDTISVLASTGRVLVKRGALEVQ
jgi:prepilin-type N-terminal cleavage/methylation domain-containing protein